MNLYLKIQIPELIHGIGHGVGLDVHGLRLSEKFNDNLTNSILTIEPAVYFKGKYGLRFGKLFILMVKKLDFVNIFKSVCQIFKMNLLSLSYA